MCVRVPRRAVPRPPRPPSDRPCPQPIEQAFNSLKQKVRSYGRDALIDPEQYIMKGLGECTTPETMREHFASCGVPGIERADEGFEAAVAAAAAAVACAAAVFAAVHHKYFSRP